MVVYLDRRKTSGVYVMNLKMCCRHAGMVYSQAKFWQEIPNRAGCESSAMRFEWNDDRSKLRLVEDRSVFKILAPESESHLPEA